MTYLLSFILTFTEIISFTLVADTLLERKGKRKNHMLIFLVFITIAHIYCFIAFSGAGQLIKFAIGIFVFYLIVLVFYSGSYAYKLFLCIIYFATLAMLDYFLMSVSMLSFLLTYEMLLQNQFIYYLFALMAKLVLFLIAFLFKRVFVGKNKVKYTSTPYSWLLLIVPIFSVLNIVTIIDGAVKSEKLNAWTFTFGFGLLVCNVVMIFLWDKLESEHYLQLKTALLEKEVKGNLDKALVVENLYKEQRKVTHDFKNHLNTIQGLLDLAKYQNATDYIHNLSENMVQPNNVVHTNNSLVDVVLNQKYNFAMQHNISISFVVNDLSVIHIKDADLITLLGNALDNAIEATIKYDKERSILVKIIANSNVKLMISIINPSLPVKISDNKLVTSKKNCLEHGFGVENIRQIVEHYKGNLLLDYQNNAFRLIAIFE